MIENYIKGFSEKVDIAVSNYVHDFQQKIKTPAPPFISGVLRNEPRMRQIQNIQFLNNLSIRNRNILDKNYPYIASVLTKNIGGIEYRENVKPSHSAIDSSIVPGDIIVIAHDRHTNLYNFLSKTRVLYPTYDEYASNLNDTLFFKHYTRGDGNFYINDNLLKLSSNVDITNNFDLDNSLTSISNQYLELVKQQLFIDSENKKHRNLTTDYSFYKYKEMAEDRSQKELLTSTDNYKIYPEYDYFVNVFNKPELSDKDNWSVSEYTSKLLEHNKEYYSKVSVGNQISTFMFPHTENLYNGERHQYVYTESDKENTYKDINIDFSLNNSKTFIHSIKSTTDVNDLVSFTNEQFKNGKYKTLISRFCSGDELHVEGGQFHSAISKYGTSHGRNLLSGAEKSVSGYTDPYCRVWTSYHQYYRYHDLIRPFNVDDKDALDYKDINDKFGLSYSRTQNGNERLDKYGVLNPKTNLVNITQQRTVQGELLKTNNRLKQCMFSIENLAWKDFTDDLSEEQKGPLGGRIMWFPPYDIKFNENVQTNWNATDFIGRGEKIYTYTNTDRSGTLSFKLLIDHPSMINYMTGKQPDNQDNQEGFEYDVLRFFAGCTSNVALKWEKNDKDKTSAEKSNESLQNSDSIENEAVEKPANKEATNKKIIFLVYFPNNYSGLHENSSVDPFVYLMNGIGSQSYTLDNGAKINTIPTNDDVIVYSQGDISENEIYGYEINSDTTHGITPKEITISDKKDKDFNIVDYNGYKLCPIKNTSKTPTYDWWYRSDSRTLGEKPVVGVSGTKDLQSYGLNSSKGFGTHVMSNLSAYGIKEEDRQNVFAFTEVFTSLYNLKLGKQTKLTEHLKNNFCDSSRMTILNDQIKQFIVNKSDGVKLKLTINGFASSDGKNNSNKQLCFDRANAIYQWLIDKFNINFDTQSKIEYSDILIGGDNSNDVKSKLGRCAKVVIEFIEEDVIEIKDTLNSQNDASTYNGEENSPEFVKIQNEVPPTPSENDRMLMTGETKHEYINDYNGRYDNEYHFFQELENSNSFIRNKITEKIQYFDPAFHSISPEGFNARLTFLHQCTRQGPTIGNSNIGGGKTAANLAFGRQPVCVLRIGDFYYTKIVIDSLSIDYDPLVWDLNVEGIGVQPMIANVSISFKFLGGHDLGGPIGRLQNALSFNYYANSSVYDNRSETIEYNVDTHQPQNYTPNNKM